MIFFKTAKKTIKGFLSVFDLSRMLNKGEDFYTLILCALLFPTNQDGFERTGFSLFPLFIVI